MHKRLALLAVLCGLVAGCQSTRPPMMKESSSIEMKEQRQTAQPNAVAEQVQTTETNAVAKPVQEQKQAAATNVVAEPMQEPPAAAEQQKQKEQNTVMILMKTSKGDIKLELNKEKAPKTVANFLRYVESGHYNGTIFHRVIDGFMIQGGGFDVDMHQKPAPYTVENEADNGLSNDVGTIAMARTQDPQSAGAQFFINVKDNDFLNFRSKTVQGWGYCVFGKVVEGMDVVNAIKSVPTGTVGYFQDVPKDPVVIESVSVIDE